MDENNILLLGDCVEKMKGLPDGTAVFRETLVKGGKS